MANDNILCTSLVQADNQRVPAIIRAVQSGGVYTLVVSGGGSSPLWLVATNNAVIAANATETDLTWTDSIGTMTGALSGATFTAPTTGKYTFRTLLQYESTGTATNSNTGVVAVTLTQSNNTPIKQTCTTGVSYVDSGGGLYIVGTNALEWTLSLTAGDTVKHRVYFQDGGDGNGLNFYVATCQLKINQEL